LVEFAKVLASIDRRDGDAKLDYASEEVVVESVADSVCASLGLDSSGSRCPTSQVGPRVEGDPIQAYAAHQHRRGPRVLMDFLRPGVKRNAIPFGLEVHPKDNIHLFLFYNLGHEVVVMQVYDKTTGEGRNVAFPLPFAYYNGNHADFIDERIRVGPEEDFMNESYSQLTDFGTDHWFKTKVENVAGIGADSAKSTLYI
jgi:hypothetical protein